MSSLQICCCKIACPRGKRDSVLSGGFSLLELIIVIGISIIIAAIAIPSFLTAYSNLQLRSAASALSGFMQRARIQAAKQNATYTIGYRSITNVNEAYIDLNNNGQWDVGEPQLTFSSTVSPAAGAPSGVGGTPTAYVLVGDTAGTTYDNATTLGYSPRGLPCAYISGVCGTPAAGYFVYYLTSKRSGGSTGWAAVVVTRAGRSKVVTWSGTAWQ